MKAIKPSIGSLRVCSILMNRLLIFCRFAFIVLTLICVGCGYHVGQGRALSEYPSISIPYTEGDTDGDLTAAIVKEVVSTGDFEYCLNDGALILVSKIVNFNDENIGFRYDQHRDGKISRSIIPSESRLSLTVEVSILEASSGRLLKGPAMLTARVDVDHDYNGNNGPEDSRINELSLGQISNAAAAFEAAEKPLNDAMARKIADFLLHSW